MNYLLYKLSPYNYNIIINFKISRVNLEIARYMAKNKKIITIIGLMGVGKTTLGSKLAHKLGYYFVDSDREIEDSEKKSINDIFKKNGEQYFRDLECCKIKEIVARDEAMVLSLGGGAFMNDEIRQILLEKTLVIWLKASIDVILHRIGNKGNRPLLKGMNKREALEELAKKRYPIYGLADLEIDSSTGNHEVLIDEIYQYLQR
ncbi:MAG TPA: shikimate kinase [Rickettsiales bacterium]|nr:shikimate kinase [Rickettsiales bacterium]